MNENETKLDDFEAKNESSDVILFSDYEPSDILGIVRVSSVTYGKCIADLIIRRRVF